MFESSSCELRAKCLTRRQSQRRDLARLLLAQEPRQLPAWLIFDVRQMISPLLLLAAPTFVLGLCYVIPTLTGWRSLAREWRAERLRNGRAALAHETAVDWIWRYHWVQV